MKKVLLEPAYILHRRPYRETSFLIEIFTLNYGRLSTVARGTRRSLYAAGLLQSFTPLLVSWSGQGELMTLTQVEPNGEIMRLAGNCLFAGFYFNELLIRLLQKWDAHSVLYRIYEKSLQALQSNLLQEGVLRSFEKSLLEEIGYGLLPPINASLKQFDPDKFYRFIPDNGFVVTEFPAVSPLNDIFSGKSLLSIAREDWQAMETLAAAKRLMRLVLSSLLGQPLYSRQLFIYPNEGSLHA